MAVSLPAPIVSTLALLAACAVPLAAQQTAPSYAELIARGDSLTDALRPVEALEAYRAAYMSDQTYEAMWKFARAQIDVAKQLVGRDQEDLRDSLYGVARLYAEAAVRSDSLDAEGHFMVANALGRLSRTRGGKERVRFAEIIHAEATRALELDSTHAGAHHVLGAWHAEVKQLSGMTRFFAKTFFGAGFFDRANWDAALAHLDRAVALEPDYLFHRLELAEVYLALHRDADARVQLEAVLRLPPTSDVADPEYQEAARRLLADLGGDP
jgi:tetratricopeptide (TPR) repeat protein